MVLDVVFSEAGEEIPVSFAETIRSDAQGTVYSVNGKTGAVILNAADVGAIQVIVEDYSSSRTYPAGAYSRHNNKLYRSIATISTPELWNDEHWAVVTVANELSYRYKKPSTGIPKTDLASAVQTSLDKADTALQSVPSTYRTASAQDVIDNGKQTKITASGLLKGNGSGGVSAAVAGTDYETPAGAKALGLSGASVGDLVRVAAVDANGKPTSWNHVPLCDIVTNQNLLDNWDFENPVNQRGQSSYNALGYTIDRWKLENTGSVSLVTISGEQFLKLTGASAGCFFSQTYENVKELAGKTVTLSILGFRVGTSYIAVRQDSTYPGECNLISDTSLSCNSVTFTVGNISSVFAVAFASFDASYELYVKAIKLEFGSEQTLAHQENGQWVLNEIPDYGEELAKCQRYYVKPITVSPNIRKINNIVYFVTPDTTLSNDFVIPSGYRPVGSAFRCMAWVVHNNAWVAGSLLINTDGTVTVEYVPAGTASTRQIAVNASWPVYDDI